MEQDRQDWSYSRLFKDQHWKGYSFTKVFRDQQKTGLLILWGIHGSVKAELTKIEDQKKKIPTTSHPKTRQIYPAVTMQEGQKQKKRKHGLSIKWTVKRRNTESRNPSFLSETWNRCSWKTLEMVIEGDGVFNTSGWSKNRVTIADLNVQWDCWDKCNK